MWSKKKLADQEDEYTDEDLDKSAEDNEVIMEQYKLIIEAQKEEIKRLKCIQDKNTQFLQDVIMELIHMKQTLPAATQPQSMSERLAAFKAAKANSEKSVREANAEGKLP